jgi:hypothetical protein
MAFMGDALWHGPLWRQAERAFAATAPGRHRGADAAMSPSAISRHPHTVDLLDRLKQLGVVAGDQLVFGLGNIISNLPTNPRRPAAALADPALPAALRPQMEQSLRRTSEVLGGFVAR